MKTYFLKASELNERFINARKNGRESSVINGLVKPTCLIIDEIGRCIFDRHSTAMFFDMIDRRYEKEGAKCMIFTSNKQPNDWVEFFEGRMILKQLWTDSLMKLRLSHIKETVTAARNVRYLP